MQVTSLGFRTDVALRVLEGAETSGFADAQSQFSFERPPAE